MPFDLDLSQAQPLLDLVRDTFSPASVNDMLLYVGKRVGVAAEEAVSAYPSPSHNPLPLYYTRQRKDGSTYKSKFKSMAQQRKVMMLVKQSKVPYRRSGTLGKSITSTAEVVAYGVCDVRVGSNLEYAPYVLDKEMQSHYHEGTWDTIQDDIEKALPKINTVAQQAVVTWVNRRLGRG